MELLADTVVTASEKSFRKPLRSTTLNIIGHGVNLQRFTYREKVLSKENLALLTAGRISPTKDIETIILSLPLLEKRGVRASLRIVGGPALASDVVYLDNLKTVVRKLSLENRVSFLGEKSFSAMAEEYRNADMVINLSGTGSMDKAVLEAMAAGCLILTSNEAFFGVLQKRFIVQQNNQKDLAEKITALLRAPHSEIRKEKERLRSFVEREHNLDATVQKIMDLYEQ
jgi:glycosyltransferase involved in cell wall biosynthesis